MTEAGGCWVLRGGRRLRPDPPCLVGILNVTPDSFSDGGRYETPDRAIAHGLALLDEGAAMIDIGAESTRPFAVPVAAEEERARLMPVLRGLRARRPEALLSVDTFRSSTARAALEAGADAINDVSACLVEPDLLEVLAAEKPGYVLMHSWGRAEQGPGAGPDIVSVLLTFFEQRLKVLVRAGLPEDHVVLDPGLGFGKTLEQSLEIFRGLDRLRELGRPLYVGVSRKSLLGALLDLPLSEREAATQTAVALLAARGVAFHRVHDVAGCSRALRLTSALFWGRCSGGPRQGREC